MNSFTFTVMLLQQRVDEALRLERQKAARNPLVLMLLRRKERLLRDRLKRSLVKPALAGS